MKQALIRIGSEVSLKGQGARRYCIEGHEKHNGLKFYLLSGIDGLFIRSSLIREKF